VQCAIYTIAEFRREYRQRKDEQSRQQTFRPAAQTCRQERYDCPAFSNLM
jgi:hypothetical protein